MVFMLLSFNSQGGEDRTDKGKQARVDSTGLILDKRSSLMKLVCGGRLSIPSPL